jgi:hypothetical protein
LPEPLSDVTCHRHLDECALRVTSKHRDAELLSTANDAECPHIDLGSHWNNAADLGDLTKVTGCKGCGRGRDFNIEEA